MNSQVQFEWIISLKAILAICTSTQSELLEIQLMAWGS